MTEFFFVLTVIYAAYVIFVAIREDKKPHVIDDSAEALMLRTVHNTPPLIPEKPIAQLIEKPTLKATKVAVTKIGLKNPQTGEIATNYANYRFMKRWIKEALVAEGLLEKIYKNNELTPDIEIMIKDAINRLESLENYQA